MSDEVDRRNKRLHELNVKLCSGGIGSMTERELFELVELYAFGAQCPGARESMMRKYKSYGSLIRSDGRGDGSLVQGFIRLVQESALVLARGTDTAYSDGRGKRGEGGAAANAARFLRDEREQRLREICRSLAGRFYDSTVESFRVTYLDGAGRWLMCEEIAEGSVGEVRVDTKRVFRRAFELGAAGLLLSHNHPSGDLMPSAADMRFTDRMRVACESVGIRLADHIIVSEGRYRSVIRGDSFSGSMSSSFDGADDDVTEVSDSFAYVSGEDAEQLGHTGVYRGGAGSAGASRDRAAARAAAVGDSTAQGGSEQLSLLLEVREEPIGPPKDENVFSPGELSDGK